MADDSNSGLSKWPDLIERIRERTPARVLADRTGAAYRTATQLQLRQDHAAARDAVARFEAAFDDAPIGMALLGLDGQFLQVNAALCDITGYCTDDEERLLAAGDRLGQRSVGVVVRDIVFARKKAQ